MSVAEDLVAARALIDTPEKWCKGREVRATENGYQMCLLGALRSHCLRGGSETNVMIMRDALLPYLPGTAVGLVDLNDRPETTHADILALFDRAIAAARAPHLSKGADHE